MWTLWLGRVIELGHAIHERVKHFKDPFFNQRYRNLRLITLTKELLKRWCMYNTRWGTVKVYFIFITFPSSCGACQFEYVFQWEFGGFGTCVGACPWIAALREQVFQNPAFRMQCSECWISECYLPISIWKIPPDKHLKNFKYLLTWYPKYLSTKHILYSVLITREVISLWSFLYLYIWSSF